MKTDKDVKDFLHSGRNLLKEIESLKKRHEKAEYHAQGTSGGVREKMSTTKKNRGDERLTTLGGISREIDDKLKEFKTKTDEIQAKINLLSNESYRDILKYRYVTCESWLEVSESMNISEKYAKHQLHNQAYSEILNLLIGDEEV